MSVDHDIVPVVMFHSVGLDKSDWVFSRASEPLETFEEKLVILKQAGYHFLFWQDLYDHMSGRRAAPARSIMLTFDDGYLDNWVYVYPLLKKYEAKGTIFVNPDFVDPNPVLRPNLTDVWNNKVHASDLSDSGFLSWAEMRQMEAGGLVDIQSHALTHTWYFTGPRVLDFHRPGMNRYPWLAWNCRPERKPFYMVENQNAFVPWGQPIYEHGKALDGYRYFPPLKVEDSLIKYVADNGGSEFFAAKSWRLELENRHSELMVRYANEGYSENEVEFKERVLFELRESKAQIDSQLNKRVDYICWPGGGYNQTVLTLAKEVGYRAWTLASRDQSNNRNRFGIGPERVKRVSSFARYRMPNGKEYGYAGGRYFLHCIERHKGSCLHTWQGRLRLIMAWVGSKVRG